MREDFKMWDHLESRKTAIENRMPQERYYFFYSKKEGR